MTPFGDNWRASIRQLIHTPGGHVHLMGIGGIGMAGVARILAAKKLRVTGCDSGTPRTLAWLRSCEIAVTTGHDPAHLSDCDWAIFSPALQPGHPERAAAETRGIPIFRRGQVLPVLAEDFRTIAVAGTHGKTTTSSMIAHILRTCGADPSFCIGGELPPDGAPAGIGNSDWLVIEADESDGTLAHYAPEIAVITNIEFDHMEHFHSKAEMTDSFRAFSQQAKTVIYCADDPTAAQVGAEKKGQSYGFSQNAHFRAAIVESTATGTHFDIHTPEGAPLRVQLPLLGRHNVANATAAILASQACGITLAEAARALETFALPKRRFETIANKNGIHIIADYAHHPSEIRAVISAAQQAGATRIWAVFQPHRYTRTAALGPDFATAFDGVEGVILLPVYSASEPPLAGGTSSDLFAHFRQRAHPHTALAPDFEVAAALLNFLWASGDTILLIGAGDIEDLGPILKANL